MKFFQFILIFIAFTMLIACGSDPNQSNKKEQSPSQKIKMPIARPNQKSPLSQDSLLNQKSSLSQDSLLNQKSSLNQDSISNQKRSPLDKLKKLTGSTGYGVHLVNKQKLQGLKTIVVKGPRLVMRGWAVDRRANRAAGGVYVVIDGKSYLARYGHSLPGIANAFGNAAFEKCGFILNIPTDSISKGKHDVTIRVISSDKTALFAANNAKKFKINVK